MPELPACDLRGNILAGKCYCRHPSVIRELNGKHHSVRVPFSRCMGCGLMPVGSHQKPVKLTPREPDLPCLHFGSATTRTVRCGTCASSQVAVHSCDVFGECVLSLRQQAGVKSKSGEDIHACDGCGAQKRPVPDLTPLQFKSPNGNLVCVVPFCHHDASSAIDLLQWIGEIGGCPNNDCVLMAACQTDDMAIERARALAEASFREVRVQQTPYMLRNEKWPRGPNWMFQVALLALREDPRPFLWLEPDCVPLKPGWLEALETEYRSAGKPFMGKIEREQGRREDPQWCPRHLTGCAIYPPGADKMLLPFTQATAPWDREKPWAWDVASHEVSVPLAHSTKLYYHAWSRNGKVPTWVATVSPGDPDNAIAITKIPPQAVLAHRCKDGSAIRVLRQLKA